MGLNQLYRKTTQKELQLRRPGRPAPERPANAAAALIKQVYETTRYPVPNAARK